MLDCSSGLNCSMTSCLKLLQQQPTVVHPQLRAGRELALNYGLCFGPSFFTGGSNLLQSIHTGLLLLSGPDLLASKAANSASTTRAAHINACDEGGKKPLVGTPRAVVPLRGRAKMWHSLPKTLQLSFLKDTVAFSLWQSPVWVKMTDSYWYSLGIFTIGRRNWSWASAELWDDVCCISL